MVGSNMKSATQPCGTIPGGEEVMRERAKVSCPCDLIDNDGKPTPKEDGDRDAENEASLGAIRWKEAAE